MDMNCLSPLDVHVIGLLTGTLRRHLSMHLRNKIIYLFVILFVFAHTIAQYIAVEGEREGASSSFHSATTTALQRLPATIQAAQQKLGDEGGST